MDASSHTRRLGSRALAHGTYAKGVSDGELVSRRIARIVKECCRGKAAGEIPIADPLSLEFRIDQSRAIRTITIIIDGSGVIQNGSTRIRYTNGYNNSFIAAPLVSIYSSDMSFIIFYFDTPTYHTVSGYYLPLLERITIEENNYITSINFTQVAPSLTSLITGSNFGFGQQPLQITSFDCANLPILETLVLVNTQNGPLNSILNPPSSLKTLYINNNSFTGIFTIPDSLETVVLSYNPITDVNNLATGLKSLSIDNTDISGSFDLINMPSLEDISITNTHISQLLSFPSTIKLMNVSDTDISGVFNLAGLNILESFICGSTAISNIINIPTSITTLLITNTNVSGVFDLSGLNLLNNFSATDCDITDVINIPSTISNMSVSNMLLTQGTADGIAAALVANGLSDGTLDIISQQSDTINISSGDYQILVSRGWVIN